MAYSSKGRLPRYPEDKRYSYKEAADEYVRVKEPQRSTSTRGLFTFEDDESEEDDYVALTETSPKSASSRGSFTFEDKVNKYKSVADEYVKLKEIQGTKPLRRRKTLEEKPNNSYLSAEDNSPRRSRTINYPKTKTGNFHDRGMFPDESVGGGIMDIVKNNRTVTLKSGKRKPDPSDGEIDLEVYCLEEDDKLKVVVELATFKQDEVHPLPVRILLLVDISGSMGIRYGNKRKPSKLNRMKRFASSLMDCLDDGDQAALVTFGEEAKILMPLEEITAETRGHLKNELKQLDKCYLSTKTNLSAGLDAALSVFEEASSSVADLLGYRNAIIVFSDGEINAGIREPGRLVHDVREKIRNMSFGLDDSQNQWVTISVIATGNDVSETMYLLSKICSSEAFYHLDMESCNSDFDMYLPVLMRKTAVAWNVSLLAESLGGAKLINEECTQDRKIRLRSSSKGMDRTQKAYFFYDLQASTRKHVGLAINMENVSDDPFAEIAKLRLTYTSFSGRRKCTTRVIRRADIEMEDEEKKQKIIEENLIMDARTVSVAALQKAAENVKSGNIEASTADLAEGESEVQKLCNKYGAMASSTSQNAKINIDLYATSLMKNLGNLLQAVQGTTGDDTTENNRHWAKMKTVSSAIAREVPTVSETVSNSNLLCPLPAIRDVTSLQMRQQIGNVYKHQGVRDSALIDKLNTDSEYLL